MHQMTDHHRRNKIEGRVLKEELCSSCRYGTAQRMTEGGAGAQGTGHRAEHRAGDRTVDGVRMVELCRHRTEAEEHKNGEKTTTPV